MPDRAKHRMLIVVGGGIGYVARSAAGLGPPMRFLKFSRGFEEDVIYGFNGKDKDMLGRSPGGGHASVVVTFVV